MIKYTLLYVVTVTTIVLIVLYDSSKEIYLTSMGDVKNSEVLKVKEIIESNYENYNVTILPSIDVISDSKVEGLNRYQTKKILKTLGNIFSEKDGKVMVLTDVDICEDVKGYKKNNRVLGASNVFGKYSVVSTYGMDRNYLLKKTVVHELGHSFGLPHCTSEHNCLMNSERRDKPKNGKYSAIYHVNDYFCESCTIKLKYFKNFSRL